MTTKIKTHLFSRLDLILFYGARFSVFGVLTLLSLTMVACQKGKTSAHINYYHCLGCHEGIEGISRNHDFDCLACHIKPESRYLERLPDHKTVIRNPSDPSHMVTFCMPCHEKEIGDINRSLHVTMAGIINQTRFLWGAQERAAPAIFGLGNTLKPLPEVKPDDYPDDPRFLVDDFLRRRCLRCHISASGSPGNGLYRSSGCAACHVIYDNDGRYGGDDKAIDKSKAGYPMRHRFTTDIPNVQCLHCHNQNNVGADYEGLFEHDYSSIYRSPLIEGTPAPMIYGMDNHHLAKDIHAEKGLWCIDCHTKKDVMGDGNLYSYALEVPMRRCTDCHGGFRNGFPNHSVESIQWDSQEVFFLSRDKVVGRVLPLFTKKIIPHQIEAHERVRCSACHAQWSFQDYGLSVIREDRVDPQKWVRLTAQADPYLEKVMLKQLEKPDSQSPFSKDWLTGKERTGLWSVGWRFRRWEYMPLGIDHNGKVAILRPRHQYLISYVDRLGNVSLNSVIPSRGDGSGKGWAFMPYVPHTVSPFGRGCDSCHMNGMSLGLGLFQEKGMDMDLMIPSPPALNEMRLLSSVEQKRLLNPSHRFHLKRLRSLISGHQQSPEDVGGG
ncbi:MAG: hypothetical protein V1930_03625 [Pseudomonadota bacterium]